MATVTDEDRDRAEDLTRELWLMIADADIVDVIGTQTDVHAVMSAHADKIAEALAATRDAR